MSELTQLIEQYKQGYTKLVHEIDGLNTQELSFKPNETSWSIKEILAHVTDAEMVHIHRMKAVLSEENPTLTAFDQDAWANRLNYQSLDHTLYLSLFQTLRDSFLPVLEHVTESDLVRFGTHNIAGKQTFLEILEHSIEHVDGHIGQIQRVKKTLSETNL